MQKKLRWLVLVAVLALVLAAGADEGMWMPHQMIDLNLKALGLRMDPGELYKKVVEMHPDHPIAKTKLE